MSRQHWSMGHGTETLRIFLLGRFAVEHNGVLLSSEVWRRRRPADLLKVLALAPDHAMHREELIDKLWPDKHIHSGANNLHRGLYDLRQTLSGPWVYVDKGVVRLDRTAWVDVTAFEASVAVGDPASLSTAVALYGGDLCPDDPYAEIFQARRDALCQRFLDAALRLAQHTATSGQVAAALDTLRRVLAVDACQEEAHRLLRRLLAQSGRRQDALRQFATCVQALQQTLGTEPAAPTVELYQAIVRGEIGPGRKPGAVQGWMRAARRLLGTTTPPMLRGRSAALAMLETFVQRREGVLLLIGEAGVGKTRLAVEGARLAEHAHAVILTGVGTELEGLAPYAPFMDAWADYLRLSGAPPTDSPFVAFTPTPTGAPQEDKLRLLQSVQQSLEALSSGKPVYLIIDDLHLVDESSLHLFHYLARATRTQPLMLVATCREEDLRPHTPVQALLSNLYRERLGQRYMVERLDLTATHQYVADLFGEDPGQALALAVYELTAGNPFYTEEVVHALQETGRHTAPLTVPRDLLNTVRERMTRLGMRAETLLVVAAVLGQRFAFEPACKAAGLPMTAALTALQRSLEARVIEEDEHGYRFRHSLMREALYSTLPRPRRVQLHRAVAMALEAEAAADQEDLAEALAHHYQAGEQPDRALPHLITSGQRAATRVGLREAVTFFEQALTIMEHLQRPPGPERFAILYGLGQMRVALSDIEAAVHDLDTAAGLTRPADGWQPTPGERAQARRWAALACIAAGDLAAAQVRLHAALADLAASPGDPELPNVLYHLAQLRWHEGQHRDAYEIAERCLREAEHVGDPQTIGRSYEMLALACHALGEWRDGLGFEAKRQQLVGSAVDVAQAFDVHL